MAITTTCTDVTAVTGHGVEGERLGGKAVVHCQVNLDGTYVTGGVDDADFVSPIQVKARSEGFANISLASVESAAGVVDETNTLTMVWDSATESFILYDAIGTQEANGATVSDVKFNLVIVFAKG